MDHGSGTAYYPHGYPQGAPGAGLRRSYGVHGHPRQYLVGPLAEEAMLSSGQLQSPARARTDESRSAGGIGTALAQAVRAAAPTWWAR